MGSLNPSGRGFDKAVAVTILRKVGHQHPVFLRARGYVQDAADRLLQDQWH
jgi:hypothetical protein